MLTGRILILGAILWCLGLPSARAQHLVLNEIMYAPTAPEPEWIELYNPDTVARVNSALSLRIGSKVLPLPTFTLAANGYIVLTKDTTALKVARNRPFPVLQCALPALRNTGDTVLLLDGNLTVERVMYAPSWGGKSGNSLERRAAWRDPNTQSAWRGSVDSSGATPGSQNSVAIHHIDLEIGSTTWQFDHDTLILSVKVTNVGSDTVGDGSVGIVGRPASAVSIPVLAMDSSTTLQLRVADISLDSTTLAIIVDAPGDQVPFNDTLSVAIPLGIVEGGVVLNEIQSAPIAPEPEWIEFFNATDRSQRLTGCTVRVNKTLTALPTFSIIAGEYDAITSNDSLLAAIRGADRSRLHKCTLPTLSNVGGSIAILDARGRLIDSARYAATPTGHSLERINPYRAGPTPDYWRISTDSTGATLLRTNSNRIKNRDARSRVIAINEDTARIAVANAGLDTIDTAALSISREDQPIVHDTLLKLLPYDSIIYFAYLGKAKPLGVSEIRSIVSIEGDEFVGNDTSSLIDRTPVPLGALLINEIMYEPIVGSCEWIELINTTDSPVSLRNCELLAGSANSLSPFPLRSGLIPPRSYGVIAADATIFNAYPDVNGQHSILLLDRSSLSLPNDSGRIVLSSADTVAIDSVFYRASWHNKYAGDLHGRSLERRSTLRPSNDSANWISSSDLQGATPLQPNSSGTIAVSPERDIHVEINPRPLRRNADTPGLIMINSAIQEGLVRVRIYGAGGQVVRTLADGRLWSGAGTLSFDGKDDDGRALTPGLYTLLIQVTDTSGNLSTKRSGLVIAP